MKKLSLIAALTLSTMLSACGGGGGGGHSFVPPANLPDITNPDTPGGSGTLKVNHNENVTEMRTRAITDSDGFTDVVKERLGDDVYAGVESAGLRRRVKALARGAENNICKSERDCNQEVFDNMIKILVDHKLENASLPEIKQALLLAGFTQQDLAGHIDDIKSAQKWMQDNPDKIKDKVDTLLGAYANLDINNSKLNLVTLHDGKQSSFVRLTLDENNRIDGVEITKNKDRPGELVYTSERDGDTNEFKTSQKIYRYGINSTHYYGTFIDSLTELTPQEQSEKLKARVDELAETGVYEGDVVENTKKAIDIALGLVADDGSLDVEISDKEIDVGSNAPNKFIFYNLDYAKDEKTTYTSYAKDMKLVYSDFGTLTKEATFSKPVLEGMTEETTVFAGGYEGKKIEVVNLTENMTFEGKAVGGVNVVEGNNLTNDDRSLPTLNLDGTARVTFDKATGQQTLKAEFNNWYDVTAEAAAGSNPDKLTFNNWKNGTADDYKFRGQSEYIVNDFTTAKQLAADPDTAIEAGPGDHSDPAFGALNIGYYGDKGIPSEATGYVFYEEGRAFNGAGLTKDEFIAQNLGASADDYYDMVKNISVNFGFGAVKK